jgi:predicted phage terminase large subunit-like protein
MSTKELTRSDLIKIRKKSDEDLLFFTRFWFKTIHGTKFIVAKHHETITAELHKIQNYQLELLNINIPPRFSKTELALNFIARSIGQNPTANWLYITSSDELRSQTSVSIRDIVTHPYFQVMYGVELKKDQNGKNLWRTKQGGGLKTATIGGQITGFGAGQMIEHDEELQDYVRDFEGAIVLDDINKIDDAEKKNANNDKVNRIIFNTIFSRKNSKDTPIINIQQRAGEDDATASLMEHYGEDNPKAKFLIMPVVSNGVPLWEWKHDLEDIEKLRTSPKTAHVFLSQYMQDPTPDKEGLLFYDKDLNYYQGELKDYEASAGFVDIADTGEDNHSVPIGKLIDNKIYIDDVLFTKQGTEYNVPLTAEIVNKHNLDLLRIESNMGGSMYQQLLQPLLNEATQVQPIRAKTKKHTRITTMAGFIKAYCVFRSDYEHGSDYDLFMRNLTQYLKDGTSKHDDAPDSIEGLCKLFRVYYPHIWDSV